MDVRLTRTDCDEAGDYVVPIVLSPRDLVSSPDIMDETVLHTCCRVTKQPDLCAILQKMEERLQLLEMSLRDKSTACGCIRDCKNLT